MGLILSSRKILRDSFMGKEDLLGSRLLFKGGDKLGDTHCGSGGPERRWLKKFNF